MNDPLASTRQTVQPGWYPDPMAPNTGATRWWDGFNWSPEHVRSAQNLAPRPIEHPSAQSYFKPKSEKRSVLPLAVVGVAALVAAGTTVF